MGYTRFNKIVGQEGVYVGANGSEVQIADSTGNPSFAGTALTATGAEINNLCDISANTETILVAGAVSVTKRITILNGVSGAYAVTLAAPDASMLGQVKIIQYAAGATNAITMALTNVQGGTAGTSASFNAVDETLVLVAGSNKWTVVGEAGVTLS